MERSFNVKLIIILTATMLYAISSFSQGFKKIDETPHDVSYYRESKVTKPLVKVLYGRPTVKNDEKVFGDKIPFNKFTRITILINSIKNILS